MPYYEFHCDNCDSDSDIYQSFEEFDNPKSKPACPKCKCTSKKKFYRKFTAQVNFIDRIEPRTAGAVGEKNARKLGKEQLQLMRDEKESRRQANLQRRLDEHGVKGTVRKRDRTQETPFWREEGEKVLNLKEVKDVKKYIETGDKS